MTLELVIALVTCVATITGTVITRFRRGSTETR